MTRKVLFFSLCVLAYSACNGDGAVRSEGGIAVASENAVAGVAGGGNGLVGNAVAPDLSIRETQALLNNFWVFEFYIDNQDPTNNRPNRGIWYQFRPDGTFEGGHWQEATNSGVWSVRREGEKVFLYLDSNNDARDAEYELQGINNEGDAMSWVGSTRFNQSHVILKAINLLTRPTKAQFGITE